MSIGAPATNPASDLELKLPATIGSAGEVVQNSTTAGTLEMGSPFRPAFSAYTSSNFDIPSGAETKALFQTELFDSDSAYDTSTSTFTVPTNMGGAYHLDAAVGVDDVDDGNYMYTIIYVDGAQAAQAHTAFSFSPAGGKIMTAGISQIMKLNAGQTVNIYVYTSTSGTQASENYCNWFSMFRLGGVAT
tara:strand:+ start:182 stop:748 length:567 start_codon:yes stop_codon:yes gene_type:complete